MSLELLALVAAAVAAAQAPDHTGLLKRVENRYNRARTVEVFFEQAYTAPGRMRRLEAGRLVLSRPGKMRWEYSTPAGKLLVSDGKQMYLYVPSQNRVERMRVKESGDLRAPLGFLLGRLDFWRDFRSFVFRPEGENVRVRAAPKSERSPYEEIEFVVNRRDEIVELKIRGQDHSVMEFRFTRERLNVPVEESWFRFVPPPGVEVVEAIEEWEQG